MLNEEVSTVVGEASRLFKAFVRGVNSNRANSVDADESVKVFERELRSALAATLLNRSAGPDRDSIRILSQFAAQYRSGAQGAAMDCDAAQALALAIDDVLSSSPPSGGTGNHGLRTRV